MSSFDHANGNGIAFIDCFLQYPFVAEPIYTEEDKVHDRAMQESLGIPDALPSPKKTPEQNLALVQAYLHSIPARLALDFSEEFKGFAERDETIPLDWDYRPGQPYAKGWDNHLNRAREEINRVERGVRTLTEQQEQGKCVGLEDKIAETVAHAQAVLPGLKSSLPMDSKSLQKAYAAAVALPCEEVASLEGVHV